MGSVDLPDPATKVFFGVVETNHSDEMIWQLLVYYWLHQQQFPAGTTPAVSTYALAHTFCKLSRKYVLAQREGDAHAITAIERKKAAGTPAQNRVRPQPPRSGRILDIRQKRAGN